MNKYIKYEQKLRSKIRNMIADHVTPEIDDWEKSGTLAIHDLIRLFSANNLFGFRFPVADGGQGLDVWAHLIFAEEIGRIQAGGVSMALTIQGDMIAPMLDEGMSNSNSRSEWLRPALTGERVYSHAISEIGAGSDPSAIATTAVPIKGGYRVNGTKHCIALAPLADGHCILARLQSRRFPFNMVLLMIDATAQGVTLIPGQKMMGNHSCPIGDLLLENVFVPSSARIGDEGMGFVIQMKQFIEERVISSARATSSASCIIQETIGEVSKRNIYDGVLMDLQSVSHRLSNLKLEADALRLLIHQTIAKWERGEKFETISSIVKLRSNRLAREVGRECVKLLGARGYKSHSRTGRFLRDGRLFAISTGSDETMQIAIARVIDDSLEKLLLPVSERPLPDISPCVRSNFRKTLVALADAGHTKETFGENGFQHIHALIESSSLLPNSQATSLLTHLDIGSLISSYACEAFRTQWIKRIVGGQASFALAITETEAGSDFNRLKTLAKNNDNGNWILNGEKTYITNGTLADGFVVLAMTEPTNPMKRFTIFAVPCNRTVKMEAIDTIGNRGCLGSVKFTNTHLDSNNILGHIGQGNWLIQSHLNKERYFIALRCYALGVASLMRTSRELKKRKTFGAPLITRQALQFRFSDCLSDLALLRSMLIDIAPSIPKRGANISSVAAMKLVATETLERIADFELQIAAAEGYQDLHPAASLYLDSIGLSIAGGGDGLLRDIVSRTLNQTRNN